MLYTANDKGRELAVEEEVDVGRSPFRRDYGRLLHSSSFRRLQGKTQLFPGHESDFFRNRLTHSLEVAQIAKGIAQMINENAEGFKANNIDLDLVEFAGLAHDLGHPPFGHNGEMALDECMRSYGGFEGNAQTLRILSRIEKKEIKKGYIQLDECGIADDGNDIRLGLNLTYRALASILKYDNPIPLMREDNQGLVKGYYESERLLVEKIKAMVGAGAFAEGGFKSIECQIMDIADDIAYCTYDFEDAMKGGFITPIELLDKIGDKSLIEYITKKVIVEVPDATEDEVFSSFIEMIPIDPDSKALEAYKLSKLIASDGRRRTEFSSEMIGKFIRGISVEESSPLVFSEIKVERDIRIKIESLKHLNYKLMIMSPRLKIVEYRGYDIVTGIFNAIDGRPEGILLLPDDIQVMVGKSESKEMRMRIICDFISGMTDRYAAEFYSRLYEGGSSIFKPL